MIYISKQVVFKKQSETLNTIIKDKEVKAKKKGIKNLVKMNEVVNTQLIINKEQYEKQKENYEAKYAQALQQKNILKQSLLKLQIRKLQLQAIQRSQIKCQMANKLKKYLRGWSEYRKENFIQSIGGIQNYRIVKKFQAKIETIFYVRPKMKQIMILKKLLLFNDEKIFQNIIFCLKKIHNPKNSTQSYLIQIYSIQGKYFCLKKTITEKDLPLVQLENPIYNLMISIKNKSLHFLHQYFASTQKKIGIEKAYRTFMFKMLIQKQRKKNIFFQRMTITNIFQSVYHVTGYQNLSFDVLVIIKKKQTKRFNSQSLINHSNGSTSSFPKIKQTKTAQDQAKQSQSLYTFYCEPVKSYEPKYMFTIQDETVIKTNSSCPELFIEVFLNKYLIQLNSKTMAIREQQRVQIRQTQKPGIHHSQNGDADKKNQTYIYNFKRQNIQIMKPRLVRIIEFDSPDILPKIIKRQLVVKTNLQKEKYKALIELAKKNFTFDFHYRISSNIIVSAYIKGQQVIFFVECFDLSSSIKTVNNNMRFPKRYWNLAKEFLDSIEFGKILGKGLIWQIKEEIQTKFNRNIFEYELEQERINQMKPIKQINRLRKLFLLAQLRQKVKTNILYIKKIQKQFATLVIIIRKSPFLKNIVDVHLYVLKMKNLFSDEKEKSKKGHHRSSIKQCEQIMCVEQDQIKYNQISLYAEVNFRILQNASILLKDVQRIPKKEDKKVLNKDKKIGSKAIQNEFYITENYFILKPFHIQFITNEYKFIERFANISLSSDEIMNELQSLSQKNDSQCLDQKSKKGRLGQKSLLKINSNMSFASIVFEKQGQGYSSIRSQEEDMIFYSLYKTNKQMFYLELFVIVSTEVNDYFKQVHKEEISKKQISCSGWTLIYKLIALWAKSSGWINKYEEGNYTLKGRESAGNYYGKGSKYKAKGRYSSDSIMEGNL